MRAWEEGWWRWDWELGGCGGEVFLFEAGEFDVSETFLFDHVDEADWFGLLEAFAANWPGDSLAPGHGWITVLSRGRCDSNGGSQIAASRAVATLVTADSACMLAGWASAGGVVVVHVIGRHVLLGCMSCKSTGDLGLFSLKVERCLMFDG